jgi:intracellular septation protein
MQTMVDAKGVVPLSAWYKLNLMWAAFFVLLGSVNLYIAYYYSNDAWVNFKFYGITGALLIFSVFQAVYLTRYVNHDEVKDGRQ